MMRPNFYVATIGEPSNAGFFILSPQPGDYEATQEIIQRQKKSTQNMTTKAKFDKINGWGHVITPPDYYEYSDGRKGTEWTFYCAPSDQGLLYHWTKYHKKDVSIMIKTDLKNFDAFPNGTAGHLAEVHSNPFRDMTNATLKSEHWCKQLKRKDRFMCEPPFRDYEHLAGPLKPWYRPLPDGWRGENKTASALHYWFNLFDELNRQYDLGVDLDRWDEERQLIKDPPLGWKPHYYKPKCW
ncbi:MAG: hypothetical protein SGARI_003365, partial [Bacillariaceae sp.]